MNDKPNCYKCQYRRRLIGDAHSECLHPDNARTLGITAHPHGIRNGWFFWPINFDPTWLLTCNGFTPQQTDAGA